MKPDVDSNYAIPLNAWAVRFWCWWHTSAGEQAVVRVVRLGWLH